MAPLRGRFVDDVAVSAMGSNRRIIDLLGGDKDSFLVMFARLSEITRSAGGFTTLNAELTRPLYALLRELRIRR